MSEKNSQMNNQSQLQLVRKSHLYKYLPVGNNAIVELDKQGLLDSAKIKVGRVVYFDVEVAKQLALDGKLAL